MLKRWVELMGRQPHRTVSIENVRSNEPAVRVEATLRFLCEQRGESEDGFKAAIHPLLAAQSVVKRAYLARVDYGRPSGYEVVLAIAGPEDQKLVTDLSSAFAKQFSRNQHLDIIFLTDTSEAELRKVCPPFYDAG